MTTLVISSTPLTVHDYSLPRLASAPSTARRKTTILTKGPCIGRGGFSIVFKATEDKTGRIVALKQARVSLRVKRAPIQHEASVLWALRAHPSIPEILGYGRIAHFELLSLPLYDKCVSDLVTESGPPPLSTVLRIADQLLSSLQFIHSHDIIHRDIKPSNMMIKTPGSCDVVVIDFGLAYRMSKSSEAETPRKIFSVFGTSTFASLNAHERSDLTYRDDLESLTYTLIWLLRGNLPWNYFRQYGPSKATLRQIFEQKVRYDGRRLTQEVPAAFGMLLDYARSLSAETLPDYSDLRKRLAQCTWDGGPMKPWKPQTAISDFDTLPKSSPPCPFVLGQIVLVQLQSTITLEEFTESSDGDPTFIHDPSLTTPEWQNPARPAVILGSRWNEYRRMYQFSVACLSRWDEDDPPAGVVSAPIHPTPNEHYSGAPIEWPWSNTSCYMIKNLARFHCLPSQATIVPPWNVSEADLELLRDFFKPKDDIPQYVRQLSGSEDSDTRNNVLLRASSAALYASIWPLDDTHFAPGVSGEEPAIDWNSRRAWFDESVKVAQRYDHDDGVGWETRVPGYVHPPREEDNFPAYTDSFASNLDNTCWAHLYQEERSKSVTLAFDGSNQNTPTVLPEDVDRIIVQDT